MNVSKIKDHKVRSGRVISPWNHSLGSTMTFSSWAFSRLPEYIWLCLIHSYYGRDDGLKRTAMILRELSTFEKSLDKPKLSKILALPSDNQERIYRTILKRINKKVLAPLTSILRDETHEVFSEYFYVDEMSLQKRLTIIKDTITKYYPHQSNEATDIRYLIIMNLCYQDKIKFSSEVKDTIQALEEYPHTPHEDERMRMYRPLVRASEMAMDEINNDFIDKFWNRIAMRTECELFYIDHKKIDVDHNEYMNDVSEVLEYVYRKNIDRIIAEIKSNVYLALVVYAYKVYCEIVKKEMGNSIAARSSIRTMIEIIIMLKYLSKMSIDKPNIWQEYQQYGIGKYKLILLKARETGVDPDSHMKPELLDLLVNEDIWEEFIDTDLRYFDQMNIRQKSEYVDEKALFDLWYDYDSNYTHGLWGAVREAAMVKCNNSAHKFHAVPDLLLKQNCIDVLPDMTKIMKRIMLLMAEIYTLPEWYLEKY